MSDPIDVKQHDQTIRETREHQYVYRRLYRVECLPDSVMQANKLEALRYKWGGYKNGFRVMQRLGDVGRVWWPMVGAVLWAFWRWAR